LRQYTSWMADEVNLKALP